MEADPPPYPMSGREQEGCPWDRGCGVQLTLHCLRHAKDEPLAQRAGTTLENSLCELAIFSERDHFFCGFLIWFPCTLMMLPPP